MTTPHLTGLTRLIGGKPLQAVLDALDRGDLGQRVKPHCDSAFQQVKNDANSTCEKVSTVIEEVRTAAGALTGAVDHVRATAQSLSQATSEQAASVEETTASIELMPTLFAQNSGKTKISTIDDIADQTGLLVLSAATETAGRGDHMAANSPLRWVRGFGRSIATSHNVRPS